MLFWYEMVALDCQSVIFLKEDSVTGIFFRNFRNGWLWTDASEEFKLASFDLIQLLIKAIFQMVFFYIVTPWRSMVTRNVYIKVLKLAVLEHILYRISVTMRSSEYCTQRSFNNSVVQNQVLGFPVKKSVHCLERPESRVQSLASRLQCAGSRIQSLVSRVHPGSSVQRPWSRVERPESSVQHLGPEWVCSSDKMTPIYFLHLSRVWSMQHHGSVWLVH